jgi:hypothetical protein
VDKDEIAHTSRSNILPLRRADTVVQQNGRYRYITIIHSDNIRKDISFFVTRYRKCGAHCLLYPVDRVTFYLFITAGRPHLYLQRHDVVLIMRIIYYVVRLNARS